MKIEIVGPYPIRSPRSEAVYLGARSKILGVNVCSVILYKSVN
jgi:hypothetical protein